MRTHAITTLVVLALASSLASAATTRTARNATSSQPNIIFLLTDDQDLLLGGLTPLKNARALIGTQGATFTNAFVSTPICCPSRSSILSGRYIHNGGATNNSVSGNCNGPAWSGVEATAFAVHLDAQGYVTNYAGKYMNNYGFSGTPSCPSANNCGIVPPGWHHWLGLVGNSRYYNYSVSVNGTIQNHGDDYLQDYFPDLVANWTVAFIHNSAHNYPGKPIFSMTAWPTPHGPHTPAPQYADAFAGNQAPRTPSYNESDDTRALKHWVVRHQDIIADGDAEGIDNNYSQRWASLLSVDDHIEAIINALDATGRLPNTYIFFTSDHGFNLGQHRVLGDKRQLYEHDIRVPLLVRGPGIAPNSTISEIVLNIDFAPTFIELAGGDVPSYIDGHSYAKVLTQPSPPSNWRSDFLIDYHGEGGHCQLYSCPGPTSNFHEIDSKNNTYSCVRTLSSAENTIYCEFEDAENFVEFYDINADHWQLSNNAAKLPASQTQAYQARIAAYKACEGASCWQV